MFLDRLVCPKSLPDSIGQSLRCNLKHVSRTNVKVSAYVNLTRPVNTCFFHGIFYYKFNGITFHKFPIELLEDFCGWMNGTSRSYLMEWSFSKVLKYSNMNHTCPYVGPIWIKADSIREDSFTFENSLMPSGQYRVDLNVMEFPESVPYIKTSLYFSISDHRIEKV